MLTPSVFTKKTCCVVGEIDTLHLMAIIIFVKSSSYSLKSHNKKTNIFTRCLHCELFNLKTLVISPH